MTYIRHINRLFLLLFLFSAALLSGCRDERDLPENPGTETGEGYTVSIFTIDNSHYSIPAGTAKVDIALISPDGVTRSYEADYERGERESSFRMYIPSATPVEDGRYVMTLRVSGGTAIGGRLMVSFSGNNLTKTELSLPTYLLDGEGTADDPYIIDNDDNFDMFVLNLIEDEANGAGLFFRQTADVRPSDQSIYAPGRGYWGGYFAGDYDGGNHTIDGLYYKGSGREESDACFGLFRELRGHASVHNVNFRGVMVSGICREAGVVAGRSTGTHTLSGITLSGSLGQEGEGSNIGGLIGLVVSGSVTARDIDLGMDVSGGKNVGGLFGAVSTGSRVEISGVTTTSTHFSVSGNSFVGGVTGLADGGFTIENVRLNHKVSAEDDDIRIITATERNLGGIIGAVSTTAAGDLSIRDVRVTCPIGGNNVDGVGGIIGALYHPGYLRLSGCRVYSIVSGGRYVGGILGYAEYQGTLKVEGTDDDTRVTVDDMAAKISGNEQVGGFAGHLRGKYESSARVHVNLPVSCSKIHCGGAFGYVSHANLRVTDFKIGESSDAANEDPVMRVTGKQNTGGFAGYMEFGSLTGPDKFNYAEDGHGIRVPDTNRFHPAFSSVVQGTESVGGLVGSAVATPFTAVSCNATVFGSVNTGGIAGYFEEKEDNSHIEDCAFFGTVKAVDSDNTGGIVGFLMSRCGGRLQDCVNYADISGKDCTGGIIGLLAKDRPTSDNGHSRTMNIYWCVNTGNVSGGKNVGGIVGFANSYRADDGYSNDEERDIMVSNCMNRGDVKGAGSDGGGGVGGIVGFSEQRIAISCCANHHHVYSTGKVQGVGGIGGRLGRDASGFGLFNNWLNMRVDECVNRGEVSSDNSDTRVGGLVGYQEEGNYCLVKNSLNAGTVTSSQKHDNGGLVGYIDHDATCHYNVNSGKVSHGNAIIGDHKAAYTSGNNYFLESSGKGWPSTSISVSSGNFKKQSSFSSLDFNKIWTMGSNGPEPKNCSWRNL